MFKPPIFPCFLLILQICLNILSWSQHRCSASVTHKACVSFIICILKIIYLFWLSPAQGKIVSVLLHCFWICSDLHTISDSSVDMGWIKENPFIAVGIPLLLPLAIKTAIFQVYLLFSGLFALGFWSRIWHYWTTLPSIILFSSLIACFLIPLLTQ